MANGSVYPFSKPVLTESLGIKFPTKMSVNIISDRKEEEDEKMQFMYGNGKQEYHEDPDFDDGFQRMEGIGCPRGRVD